MSDLISRSELLKMLRSSKVKQEDSFGNTRQLIAMDIDKLIKYVENMPDAYNVAKIEEIRRHAQEKRGGDEQCQ